MFWVGLSLFIAIHLIPLHSGLRSGLVATLGEKPFKGVFALVALCGIALIVLGYRDVPYQELWETPSWASRMAFVVMPIAFILWAAAEVKSRIRLALKHPMTLGIILWAAVHTLNNGDFASVVLFGSFGLYAIISLISANHRGKVPTYEAPDLKQDVKAVVVGLVLFGAVLWGHEFLFGIEPVF